MTAAQQTRLAITEDDFAEFARALDDNDECAAVIAASLVRGRGNDPTGAVTFIGRAVSWVPVTAYLERNSQSLSIASDGWVPAFRAAIRDGLVPVFVHTHPAGTAHFSRLDDQVDDALAHAARAFGAPGYASMVVAGGSDSPAVIARFQLFDEHTERLDQWISVNAVRVAGASLQLLLPPTDPQPVDDSTSDRHPVDLDAETFDRQVRMLGRDGQQTLTATNVAIIGVGGTGSAVATQLARVGVGTITLVDDDDVTAPTPTRGHGIRVSDIGQAKVATLGSHLREIGLGTEIVEVNDSLNTPRALEAIQHADVVFSCVDGHGARLILNRFAYAHVAVVIDLAVLVSLTGQRTDIDERVTWIGPGAACLLCRGRLDPALANAENLDPERRRQLAGEGYVQAAETPQPAIVTLTTLVASLATTELLLRLTGIGSTDATELLLRPHLGDLRRNRIPQRPGCFCSDPRFLGRGLKAPYLDLLWPEPPLARSLDESSSTEGGS